MFFEKNNKGFLSKTQFEDFVFYLELKLNDTSYLTIVRPTSGKANICVKLSNHTGMLLDTTIFDKTGGVNSVKKFIEEHINFCMEDYRKIYHIFSTKSRQSK